MALTIDSIYKPFNEFFLSKYKMPEGSKVFFRFDKFPSPVGDQITGVSSDDPRVVEAISGFVNDMPVEDPDGIHIAFTSSQLDDMYHARLLNACIPFAKPDDPLADKIISTITSVIAEARRAWEAHSPVSSSGVMGDYRRSLCTPNNWQDPQTTDIWTHYSFNVTESVSVPVDNNPKFQLWKLKLDDAAITNLLAVDHTTLIQPLMLHAQVLHTTPAPATTGTFIASTHLAHLARPVPGQPRRAARMVRDHRGAAIGRIATPAEVKPVRSFALGKQVFTSIQGLELKKKLQVTKFIRQHAPTREVTTNSISISFDYCFVRIDRPWLSDAFLRSGSWFIPGMEKGQLSSFGMPGNLSVLPIGFVAIRNLVLSANWSGQDLELSKEATDFGPFEVNFDSVTNQLAHPGIQVIGWMMEKMPDLPPVTAP